MELETSSKTIYCFGDSGSGKTSLNNYFSNEDKNIKIDKFCKNSLEFWCRTMKCVCCIWKSSRLTKKSIF